MIQAVRKYLLFPFFLLVLLLALPSLSRAGDNRADILEVGARDAGIETALRELGANAAYFNGFFPDGASGQYRTDPETYAAAYSISQTFWRDFENVDRRFSRLSELLSAPDIYVPVFGQIDGETHVVGHLRARFQKGGYSLENPIKTSDPSRHFYEILRQAETEKEWAHAVLLQLYEGSLSYLLLCEDADGALFVLDMSGSAHAPAREGEAWNAPRWYSYDEYVSCRTAWEKDGGKRFFSLIGQYRSLFSDRLGVWFPLAAGVSAALIVTIPTVGTLLLVRLVKKKKSRKRVAGA